MHWLCWAICISLSPNLIIGSLFQSPSPALNLYFSVLAPNLYFLAPPPNLYFPTPGLSLRFIHVFFFKVFNLSLGAITTTIYNYKNFCSCEIVWIDNCHSTIQATWLPTTATGKGHREKKILIKKKISNSRKIYPNREKKKSIERSLCKSREQYLL